MRGQPSLTRARSFRGRSDKEVHASISPLEITPTRPEAQSSRATSDKFDNSIDDKDMMELATQPLEPPEGNQAIAWSEPSETRRSSPVSGATPDQIWDFNLRLGEGADFDPFSSPKSGFSKLPDTLPLPPEQELHTQQESHGRTRIDLSETATTDRRSSPFDNVDVSNTAWDLRGDSLPSESPPERASNDHQFATEDPPNQKNRNSQIPSDLSKEIRDSFDPSPTQSPPTVTHVIDDKLINDQGTEGQNNSVHLSKKLKTNNIADEHPVHPQTQAIAGQEKSSPATWSPSPNSGQVRRKRPKQRAKTPIRFDEHSQAVPRVSPKQARSRADASLGAHNNISPAESQQSLDGGDVYDGTGHDKTASSHCTANKVQEGQNQSAASKAKKQRRADAVAAVASVDAVESLAKKNTVGRSSRKRRANDEEPSTSKPPIKYLKQKRNPHSSKTKKTSPSDQDAKGGAGTVDSAEPEGNQNARSKDQDGEAAIAIYDRQLEDLPATLPDSYPFKGGSTLRDFIPDSYVDGGGQEEQQNSHQQSIVISSGASSNADLSDDSDDSAYQPSVAPQKKPTMAKQKATPKAAPWPIPQVQPLAQKSKAVASTFGKVSSANEQSRVQQDLDVTNAAASELHTPAKTWSSAHEARLPPQENVRLSRHPCIQPATLQSFRGGGKTPLTVENSLPPAAAKETSKYETTHDNLQTRSHSSGKGYADAQTQMRGQISSEEPTVEPSMHGIGHRQGDPANEGRRRTLSVNKDGSPIRPENTPSHEIQAQFSQLGSKSSDIRHKTLMMEGQSKRMHKVQRDFTYVESPNAIRKVNRQKRTGHREFFERPKPRLPGSNEAINDMDKPESHPAHAIPSYLAGVGEKVQVRIHAALQSQGKENTSPSDGGDHQVGGSSEQQRLPDNHHSAISAELHGLVDKIVQRLHVANEGVESVIKTYQTSTAHCVSKIQKRLNSEQMDLAEKWKYDSKVFDMSIKRWKDARKTSVGRRDGGSSKIDQESVSRMDLYERTQSSMQRLRQELIDGKIK